MGFQTIWCVWLGLCPKLLQPLTHEWPFRAFFDYFGSLSGIKKKIDFYSFVLIEWSSICAGSTKFENPLKPCCGGISSGYSCGSEDKNGIKKYTICDDPKSAFFWDSAHPTQEGWRAVYLALQATLEQL